jgi:hypothetical protein
MKKLIIFFAALIVVMIWLNSCNINDIRTSGANKITPFVVSIDSSITNGVPSNPNSIDFFSSDAVTSYSDSDASSYTYSELLAERSTARRLKALTLLLPVLTSAIESGLKVHRRAHTNGKGALPDVLSQ